MNLSIITVTYNNYNGLKKTMESVLKQSYRDYEVIIVDGGSTDGTCDLLEEYQQCFDELKPSYRFVSERDKGIYNAMNKGIRMAEGQWIIFMNAGDFFYSEEVLDRVFAKNRTECDVLYGKCKKINGDKVEDGVLRDRWGKAPVSLPTSHQAIFAKASILKEQGFNEGYRFAADYEWFLRCYMNKKKITFVDEYICFYDTTGETSTNLYKTYMEYFAIRNKYGIGGNRFFQECKRVVWYIKDKLAKKK